MTTTITCKPCFPWQLLANRCYQMMLKDPHCCTGHLQQWEWAARKGHLHSLNSALLISIRAGLGVAGSLQTLEKKLTLKKRI